MVLAARNLEGAGLTVGVVESEINQRRVALLAIRLMVMTFVVVTIGALTITQVHARAKKAHDSSDEAQSQAQKVAPTTVLRISSGGMQRSTVGSGFPVGKCLLTNHHIVDDASYLAIGHAQSASSPGVETWGSVVASSPESDVAVVIGGEGQIGTTATLSSEALTIGQPITMVGYHGGSSLVHVNGLVHAVVDGSAYGISGPVILIDSLASQGMSGGPVFNRHGEVVGMLSRVDELTGLTVAISAVSLERHLERAEMYHQC